MKITPSPCLIASSNISIQDGIRMLVESNSSYLLLTNEQNQLSGIFTKTDLASEVEKLISNTELNKDPIHTVMTKPVKTLSVKLIHTAPEFMIANKIEHVPVTELNSETGTHEIVGIVTSDSIFEFMVRLRGVPPIYGGEKISRKRKTIGVMGADGGLFRLIDSVFNASMYINVERYKFTNFNFTKVSNEVDALVIDIDEAPPRLWIPIIKEVVANAGVETVFVTHSPDLREDISEALKKIEVSGYFKIFEKPIDVSRLTIDLEKIWAELIT